MEKVLRSVGLIQKFEKEHAKFLLKWQPERTQLNFVIGERLEKESFRESITREVSWQLGLDRKSDFLVSNMAQLSMEYSGTLPGTPEKRSIAVAFYLVHLYGKTARNKVGQLTTTQWITAAEICDGWTDLGVPIDPIAVHWINRWQILQSWQ
jgi:hypothetical protein